MQHIKKNYSNMPIHTILCDIDGSLMKPSSGLYVDEEIAKKIIALEEQGMLVILNSARALSGVLPLSRQLKMDEFGGYVISCNGANVKDAQNGHTLFEYAIQPHHALDIWHTIINYQLAPGILQPRQMLALKMTKGYELDAKNCIVAYEPIWAIGTGRTATPEQAQEVCAAIRATLAELYGADIAQAMRVLYGGSMNEGNVEGLLAREDIDGGLIGGAALKAESFIALIKACL